MITALWHCQPAQLSPPDEWPPSDILLLMCTAVHGDLHRCRADQRHLVRGQAGALLPLPTACLCATDAVMEQLVHLLALAIVTWQSGCQGSRFALHHEQPCMLMGYNIWGDCTQTEPRVENE